MPSLEECNLLFTGQNNDKDNKNDGKRALDSLSALLLSSGSLGQF